MSTKKKSLKREQDLQEATRSSQSELENGVASVMPCGDDQHRQEIWDFAVATSIALA